jgi:transposase
VTVVGMESTSVYWRPVFYMLKDAFEVQLLNPAHMRRVPGRKTDVSDAAWICQITQHGLVTPSFIPPPVFRQLRTLTRYRRAQIEERTREVQRLDKVLQDAGIKLSSVATDILGVSGRVMIDALIAGERDPAVLSDLAKRSMRKKIPALAEALLGPFNDNHALLFGQMLANLDHVDDAIAQVSARIEPDHQPLPSPDRAVLHHPRRQDQDPPR